MIVVVADDISGAAELAGAGFCHGLTAEVHAVFDGHATAQLVVIDTNSRGCLPTEAARRVAKVAADSAALRPDLLYKKIDSVLRGPVLAELTAMLAATGKPRAVLVPANPSRGRCIENGRYLIDGIPLDETDFAADPEHPARSADVLDLLGANDRSDVVVLKPGDEMPRRGIIVGQAAEPADLARWAKQIDEETLPAGAVDFFVAVLAERGFRCDQPAVSHIESSGPENALFICGSAQAWDGTSGSQATQHNVPAVQMPGELMSVEPVPEAIDRWAGELVAVLDHRGVAMAAIGGPVGDTAGLPAALVEHLAELARAVLQRRTMHRLFVEGGQTASALVRRLGWSPLSVCDQLQPGIVATQPPGRPFPILTIKPGSYRWPDQVWDRRNHP